MKNEQNLVAVRERERERAVIYKKKRGVEYDTSVD